MILTRDFSWQRGVDHFAPEGARIHISELPCGFAYTTPYLLRHTSNSVLTYPPASSLHFTRSYERWPYRGSFRLALRRGTPQLHLAVHGVPLLDPDENPSRLAVSQARGVDLVTDTDRKI